MILLIDNYDSFVHNLARYIGKLGRTRHVVRNDAITLEEVEALSPHAIIISPGPCTPQEAGISNGIIRHFAPRIPILGVCLGHQCIGAQFGGRVIRAQRPCHGKMDRIVHNGESLFMGLPNPMEAGRYHSLIVDLSPESPLERIAWTESEEILMGIRHKDYPLYGVQFHPESVLTPYGLDLIRNFLTIADEFHDCKRKAA